MWKFAWSHLRFRAGRAAAAFVGIFLATTGFVVLTGTTSTSRLEVTGAVERNGRPAYDILVRPRGTRQPLESTAGLVRGNYLSGQFGGISTAQLRQVTGVAGVDVVAPIAMVGYASTFVTGDLDVTNLVDLTAQRQLLRLDPQFAADRGLSAAHAQPVYVYISRLPLLRAMSDRGTDPTEPFRFPGGRSVGADTCSGNFPAALEVQPDGQGVAICDVFTRIDERTTVNTDLDQSRLFAVQLRPDGRFVGVPGAESEDVALDRLTVPSFFHVPFLVAGIDPIAEDRLVGLRGAVVAGRYLQPQETSTVETHDVIRYPALATTQPAVDVVADTAVAKVDITHVPVGGVPPQALRTRLEAEPTSRLRTYHQDVGETYRTTAATALETGAGLSDLDTLVQPGAVQYHQRADGSLEPTPTATDVSPYLGRQLNGIGVPWQVGDTAYRTLRRIPGTGELLPFAKPVGLFDPAKLAGFSELSRVPMETYQPPAVTGRDQTTRDLLHGQPLLPGGNPAGYLTSPPLMLTTLAGAEQLLRASPDRDAPISAIRVRVDDRGPWSRTAAEHVRLVAQQIAVITGLDVDITYGSAPAPQAVDLSAGAFGRPALQLTEEWSRKGVASVLVQAVDRKSAALFVLILVVSALFLTNAVSAAVRDRTAELAILGCFGWPARRIATAILTEVAAIGTAAGLCSLALAWPVGQLLRIQLPWEQILLAVPVAVVTAVLAALPPAIRAGRSDPGRQLHPGGAARSRSRRSATLTGMAVTNLLRAPGRTMIGAASLAIGVASLTMLLAVTYAFHGAAVGTLLGDVVSVQVRGVDETAVLCILILAAGAVADTLYLNVRQRSAELSTLRATGWTETALIRLITMEAVGVGFLGAVAGAGTGLTAAALFSGHTDARLIAVCVASACLGVAIAVSAAVVPAIALHRLPTARLLAEE